MEHGEHGVTRAEDTEGGRVGKTLWRALPATGRVAVMKTKTLIRWPGLPDAFVSKFGDVFTAVLSGWDRLRLCGTLRPWFNPEWMRGTCARARCC